MSAFDLKTLATEEDVTDILNLYHDFFEHDADEEDEQPICDILPGKQQLNDCGGEFGMDVEAGLKTVTLAVRLGFRNGLPMPFNLLRDRSGTTPWDKSFGNPDPLPENLSKMRLHWHQLAGAHSIIRSLFTAEADSPHTTGVLVGDEVGLGKTTQAIAVIAFLNTLVWLQDTNRTNRPKIIRKFAYMSV